MKTQTIHTSEMTARPFFGPFANQTTHNPTSAARRSTDATTHDHKEVTMKTQVNALSTRPINPQPTTNNRTQMIGINSLLRKFASIVPKSALQIIVVLGLLAASPMAFAQACWYSWAGGHTTLFYTPGSSITDYAGTLYSPYLSPGWYLQEWAQSGTFAIQNLQVGYDLTAVNQHALVPIFSSPNEVTFSGIVPSTAVNGQTANVTFQLYDVGNNLLCQTTVTVQVVTSPGLSTEMNTIGGNNKVDEYYKGTDSHVYRLSWNGSWQYTDLTAMTGAPNADYLSTVVSQVDPLNNRSEVFYLDSSGNVEELYTVGTAWSVTKIPAAAVRGSALVCLVNTIARTVQVHYIDAAGHIHQLWWNGTSWVDNDLMAGTNAPIAATGSSLATEVNTIANTVELYYIANDQTVKELWWNGTWNTGSPSGTAKAAVGSALVSLVNTVAHTVQVNYLDSAGHIHQLWWNGTSWVNNDLTSGTNTPIAATGSSLATEVNMIANTVELYYIANDQTVKELWWNGAWHTGNPSAGAAKAAVGSPLVSLVNTIAHTVQVHYIGTDDHIHELWWNGSWYTDDVNSASNDPNDAEP